MGSNAVFDALVKHALGDASTVAVLEQALASDDEYMNVRGIGGLAAIGRDMSAYIPTRATLLVRTSASTQTHAESAFVGVGESARPVLRELVKMDATQAAATRVSRKLDSALEAAGAADD